MVQLSESDRGEVAESVFRSVHNINTWRRLDVEAHFDWSLTNTKAEDHLSASFEGSAEALRNLLMNTLHVLNPLTISQPCTSKDPACSSDKASWLPKTLDWKIRQAAPRKGV
jgi:hypothetical protein